MQWCRHKVENDKEYQSRYSYSKDAENEFIFKNQIIIFPTVVNYLFLKN